MDFAFEIPEAQLANFESALREYAEATGKDASYVVNRQGLNVAIKTAQNTPTADAGAIRAVSKRAWWPKYVAKRIKRGNGVKLRGKLGKRYKGRKVVNGSQKFTVAEARAVSKQIIRNRIKKRGYVRSGWSVAIARLSAEKLKMKGRVTGVPSFTRHEGKAPGDVVVATPGVSPVCEIINRASAAEKVSGPALVAGLSLAATDMREFVRDRYGETAKRFNAK